MVGCGLVWMPLPRVSRPRTPRRAWAFPSRQLRLTQALLLLLLGALVCAPFLVSSPHSGPLFPLIDLLRPSCKASHRSHASSCSSFTSKGLHFHFRCSFISFPASWGAEWLHIASDVDLAGPQGPFSPSKLQHSRPCTNANAPLCVCWQNRWVYVYDLPAAFNRELLTKCPSARLAEQARLLGGLGKSEDAEEGSEAEPADFPICREPQNRGLGPSSDYGYTRGGPALGPGTGWFATGELALEHVFFERLLSHPCRTCESLPLGRSLPRAS